MYQGSFEVEKRFGKAPATVLHLLSKYCIKKNYPNHVYVDNLFTTIPLLHELETTAYHGTGKIRVNRLSFMSSWRYC